jgi:hypothetical protein
MAIDILLWLAAALLLIAGFIGLVLPAIPGAPLIFAGMLLAAWAEDFQYIGAGTLSVLALMAALSYAADFAAGALGAKRFGASRRAVIGAAIGAIAGLFFGLPGVLLGPFIGAVVGELSTRRSLGDAGRAGVGATLGLVLGAAAKIALAFAMIGTFLLMRLL